MIKTLNELPYIANLAKANLNRVVKVTYTRSFRPNDEKTVIASIREVNERFGFIEFGHPMDINKENHISAGAIGLYYDYQDGTADKIDIKFINESEFLMWCKQYRVFHDSIIKEKGMDVCIENHKELRF